MKFVNRSQTLAVFLSIILFAAFLHAQISLFDRLYGYQPYVQKFFTDYGESDQLLNKRVSIYSGELALPHASLLRTTAYIMSNGHVDNSQIIYTYGAIVARAIFVLLVMMIVITMTRKVQYALVMGLIIFTSPFFVFRSTSLVPENIAILFFLLLIWALEQYKHNGRVVFMPVVIMAIIGNVAYDPTSIIFNAVIIVAYVISFGVNKTPRKIEVTLISVLITVVLLSPMFDTISTIITTSFNHFGDNSIFNQYKNIDQLPTPSIYFELIGYPVFIFATLGIISIIRWQWRRDLHILIMLTGTLALMLNLSPTIHIDPWRMQAYLYVILLLCVAVYIALLFSRISRFMRMMLISILISYGIATMLTNPPFQSITADEIELAQLANTQLDAQPDDIVFIGREAASLAMLITHPEQLCTYYDPISVRYLPPQSGEIPPCNKATFVISISGLSLSNYQILSQADNLTLYQRTTNIED
jgi:hypothetical protein